MFMWMMTCRDFFNIILYPIYNFNEGHVGHGKIGSFEKKNKNETF